MTAAKNDMNRVGLFSEMQYITVGDPYVPSSKFAFNQAAYKGKQMIPGAMKDRSTALQDGYFTKQFSRVFEQEAYTDAIALRRRKRMEEAKKNITTKPFITFHGETKPEGLGSTYGTFQTKTEYFSPKTHDKPKHETEKPNIKTNPPKKGTGYGYINVGLEKYPEYKSEKYDAPEQINRDNYKQHQKLTVDGAFKAGIYHKVFFDKNPFLTEKDSPVFKEKTRSKSDPEIKPFKPSSPPKKSGGNKDGCFTKFPATMDDPFKGNQNYKPSKKIVNSSGKLFTPQQGPKSKPQSSVINNYVSLKINRNNFKNASSIATYKLNTITAH